MARALRTDQPQSQVQHEARSHATNRRDKKTLPVIEVARHFHQLARGTQRERGGPLHRVMKDQVHHAADDADDTGQEEMECFFADAQPLANAQETQPMLPQECLRGTDALAHGWKADVHNKLYEFLRSLTSL